VNVAVMLGIDHLIRYPAGRIGRILNSGALVTVGTLSYSLYLWQEPFVNRSAYSAFAAFPQNLVLAFAAAAASYYLVERPFLRLRPRLETRWFGPRVGASRIEQATGL
jgi:peptidoglycan/LPS O-acetylase OafA/YrhL